MKVVTPNTMGKMDKTTIDKFGIPGIVLMENAGREVANTIIDLWRKKKR